MALEASEKADRGDGMTAWHESEIEQLIEALLCESSIEWIAETIDRNERDVRIQIARLGYTQGLVETLH
jgi:hypothetical protein